MSREFRCVYWHRRQQPHISPNPVQQRATSNASLSRRNETPIIPPYTRCKLYVYFVDYPCVVFLMNPQFAPCTYRKALSSRLDNPCQKRNTLSIRRLDWWIPTFHHDVPAKPQSRHFAVTNWLKFIYIRWATESDVLEQSIMLFLCTQNSNTTWSAFSRLQTFLFQIRFEKSLAYTRSSSALGANCVVVSYIRKRMPNMTPPSLAYVGRSPAGAFF